MSNPLMPVEGIREGTILWFNFKEHLLMVSHIKSPTQMYNWGAPYHTKYFVDLIKNEGDFIQLVMLLSQMHNLGYSPYNTSTSSAYILTK